MSIPARKTAIDVCRWLSLAILLAAQLAWAGIWLSQVNGTCVGEDGQPLAQAILSFHDPGTGRHFQVMTDSSGAYFRLGVESGVYEVEVTREGKQLAVFHQVEITWSNSLITVNFDIARNAVEIKRDRLHQEVYLGSSPLPESLAAEPKAEAKKVAAINAKLAEAKVLGAQGNWLAAADVLGAALDIDPKRDLPWAHLGEAYRQAAASSSQAGELLDKSILAYQHAISLHSEAAYHNNLGQAYAELKQWDDAVREFQQAAQLAPGGSPVAEMNAGVALLAWSETQSGEAAVGSLRQAAEALGRVTALEAQNSEAYYLRGLCLLRLAAGGSNSSYAQVAEAFNHYLTLDAAGPHAAEVRAMLESLGSLEKKQ